jgi:uncharacterized protein DUF2877
MTPARALAAGVTACRALAASGGRARVLARPGGAAFVTAAGEIVWLGPATAPLHPRAVLVRAVPDVAPGGEVGIDVAGVTAWAPATALGAGGAARLRAGWRALTGDLAALGAPAGFGARLAGQPLAFPLDGADDDARALAEACARDDAAAAAPAALALLGLGGGLTPSGDDFVGAALFARHLLAAAGLGDAPGWRRLARAVTDAAATRTHPISAALLGDLAHGGGHAPLHDLVAALAAGEAARARPAAAALVRLGHSSGWDMLAGLGAGLAVAA